MSPAALFFLLPAAAAQGFMLAAGFAFETALVARRGRLDCVLRATARCRRSCLIATAIGAVAIAVALAGGVAIGSALAIVTAVRGTFIPALAGRGRGLVAATAGAVVFAAAVAAAFAGGVAVAAAIAIVTAKRGAVVAATAGRGGSRAAGQGRRHGKGRCHETTENQGENQ